MQAVSGDRLDKLEALMLELRRSNEQLRAEISENRGVFREELSKNRGILKQRLEGEDRRLWQPETAERLHDQFMKLESMIVEPLIRIESNVEGFVGRLKIGGYSIFNKWTLAIGLATLGAVYVGRRFIYDVVADESAELGKVVMEKNTENVVHTLNAIARDPETLAALIALLASLIDDPATQSKLLQLLRDLFLADSTRGALLDLLVGVFQDEYLCTLTGEFLLHSLNKDVTREMLERQLAALISVTANDRQVQRDVGVLANESMKDAVLPSWVRSSGRAPQPESAETKATSS